ncbi:MAG: YegP family protein [Clostridia bacterium]|nr:YegP family protein [Clostridia bacterium]
MEKFLEFMNTLITYLLANPIILGVCGGALALIIIAIIALCIKKSAKKRKAKKAAAQAESVQEEPVETAEAQQAPVEEVKEEPVEETNEEAVAVVAEEKPAKKEKKKATKKAKPVEEVKEEPAPVVAEEKPAKKTTKKAAKKEEPVVEEKKEEPVAVVAEEKPAKKTTKKAAKKEEPVVEEKKEEPAPVVAEEKPTKKTTKKAAKKEEPVVEEKKEEPAPVVAEEKPAKKTTKKPAKKEEPVVEEKKEEPAPVVAEEKPAKKTAKKPAEKKEEVKEVKAEEKKPAKKTAEKKTEEVKPARYSGKWVLFKLLTSEEGAEQQEETYFFELHASNGEKLLESEEYSSIEGARKGIETHKANILKKNFRITTSKTGEYIFTLLSGKGTLLCNGENYNSKERCESALNSTVRFAETAVVDEEIREIVVNLPKEEDDEQPAAETTTGAVGKWIISSKEVDGEKVFYFELFANNGEKLLSSEEYTSYVGAVNGLNTHKANIEKDNFRIAFTKRGDYIYKLLSSNGQLLCLGEHYKTKKRCESAVESVKRFAKESPVLTDAEHVNEQ